jgi:hypothetical protein
MNIQQGSNCHYQMDRPIVINSEKEKTLMIELGESQPSSINSKDFFLIKKCIRKMANPLIGKYIFYCKITLH